MKHLLWLLLLVISTHAYALNVVDLQKMTEAPPSKPLTLESYIHSLPAEFKKLYTLLKTSNSVQYASPTRPRALLFNPDFIMSYQTDPEGQPNDNIEVISFDERERKFSFHEIQFPNALNGLRRAEFHTQNPGICAGCHGQDPKPIWQGANLWLKAFGSNSDHLLDLETVKNQEKVNPPEKWDDPDRGRYFYETSKDDALAWKDLIQSHPERVPRLALIGLPKFYPYLPIGSDDTVHASMIRPNLLLTRIIQVNNSARGARILEGLSQKAQTEFIFLSYLGPSGSSLLRSCERLPIMETWKKSMAARGVHVYQDDALDQFLIRQGIQIGDLLSFDPVVAMRDSDIYLHSDGNMTEIQLISGRLLSAGMASQYASLKPYFSDVQYTDQLHPYYNELNKRLKNVKRLSPRLTPVEKDAICEALLHLVSPKRL